MDWVSIFMVEIGQGGGMAHEREGMHHCNTAAGYRISFTVNQELLGASSREVGFIMCRVVMNIVDRLL